MRPFRRARMWSRRIPLTRPRRTPLTRPGGTFLKRPLIAYNVSAGRRTRCRTLFGFHGTTCCFCHVNCSRPGITLQTIFASGTKTPMRGSRRHPAPRRIRDCRAKEIPQGSASCQAVFVLLCCFVGTAPRPGQEGVRDPFSKTRTPPVSCLGSGEVDATPQDLTDLPHERVQAGLGLAAGERPPTPYSRMGGADRGQAGHPALPWAFGSGWGSRCPSDHARLREADHIRGRRAHHTISVCPKGS